MSTEAYFMLVDDHNIALGAVFTSFEKASSHRIKHKLTDWHVEEIAPEEPQDERVSDLINSDPDHLLGYTKHKIRATLTPAQYLDFMKWMRHQAISIEGSMAIYHTSDVIRWALGEERWRVNTDGE